MNHQEWTTTTATVVVAVAVQQRLPSACSPALLCDLELAEVSIESAMLPMVGN